MDSEEDSPSDSDSEGSPPRKKSRATKVSEFQVPCY